ncbi:PC3-like endoprotease variant B isoform X1 [Saccostrea echinata]|uniref:PC3-like endoprotease variant B isoform X1 n=2 Tax=Saccostrea echinata TaxID=191078 RepID=UPI002A83F5F0|nr:PC3-like endoprotease variant B isoform X1 [Saccostrea echinata]
MEKLKCGSVDKNVQSGFRMFVRVMWVLLLLGLMVSSALPVTSEEEEPDYLNLFLVKVHKRSAIHDLAAEHGFKVTDELEELGYHLLEHEDVSRRSKRSAENHVKKLQDDARVKFVQQQKLLIREKREILYDKQLEMPERNFDPTEFYRAPQSHLYSRDFTSTQGVSFNDPYYKDQWYCDNYGQSGGKKFIDLNVKVAWNQGYTGKGVTITVLDDGMDHTHPDLQKNYSPFASADLNDKDDKNNDPMPNTKVPGNSHGTRCAGEIAAEANNNVCSVGVAYNAKVGGIRMLDGAVYDTIEAKAVNFKNQFIDVMSASWGPRDNGRTLEGPGPATLDALVAGVNKGRNGKGTIYVWATGNGGVHDDDCGCDGYVSSPYTLSVGSVTDRGQAPYFDEKCASTMTVVPSGGEIRAGEFNGKPKIKVVTTDINGGCILGFEGTSAAAPLAAACTALALEANPDLTWRDMQHIVVETSKIPSVDHSWIINGAGKHVSHSFGFGVMDCGAMVNAALNWQTVPELKIQKSQVYEINRPIPTRDCVSRTVQYVPEGSPLIQLEHVQLYIKLQHTRRGDVQIYLTSPSKTESEMLSTRMNDESKAGIDFTFMTVHNWGENPSGNWEVKVCDNRKSTSENTGKLEKFQVIYYGTTERPATRSTGNQQSHKLPLATVEEIEKSELLKSRNLKLKRNTGDKKKKSYPEQNVNVEKERAFGNDFGEQKLDDQLEDREFENQKERKSELYKKVLEDLEDMLEDRGEGDDDHYREEKHGRDKTQELLDEIDRILKNNG